MTKPLSTGVLKTWKEDRGFGFITPDNGGKDLFIHISALGQPERRPVSGDIIHYQVARDRHGKLRAINAQIDGVKAQQFHKNNAVQQGAGSIWIKGAVVGGLIITLGLLIWFYLKSSNKI